MGPDYNLLTPPPIHPRRVHLQVPLHISKECHTPHRKRYRRRCVYARRSRCHVCMTGRGGRCCQQRSRCSCKNTTTKNEKKINKAGTETHYKSVPPTHRTASGAVAVRVHAGPEALVPTASAAAAVSDAIRALSRATRFFLSPADSFGTGGAFAALALFRSLFPPSLSAILGAVLIGSHVKFT